VTVLNVLGKIIGMLGSIWLARCLGPADLGVISFVMVLQSPLQRIISLGLDPILVRVTRDMSDPHAQGIFRHFTVLRMRLALWSLVLWVVVFVVVWFAGRTELASVAWILGPLLLAGAINWISMGQRFGRLREASLVDFVSLSIVAGGLLWLLVPGASLVTAAWIYCGCNLVGFANSARWGRDVLGGFRQAKDAASFQASVKIRDGTWPLLIMLASFGYTTLELPLVSFLYGFEQAGFYRVGGTLATGILTLVGTFGTVMYPRYVEWSKTPELLALRLRQLGIASAAIALGGIAFLYFSGHYLLETIFGAQYVQSFPILIVLGAAKLTILWVNIWSIPLLALRQEKFVARVAITVSLLCILSNLLVSSLNYGGVAVASLSLVSECIVGIVCYWKVRKLLS
tara:strand:- start:1775 stop:2974 length:1200 start_codon:yes stop_codon:yes gene_type:complete